VSTSICIFEDRKHANFLPLSLSRPVFDLRIGCGTLRSRLLDGLPAGPRAVICRAYLAALTHEASPRVSVNSPAAATTWFLNGRWLAMGGERERVLNAVGDRAVGVKGGHIVAAKLPPAAARELAEFLVRRVSASAVDAVSDALRSVVRPTGERPKKAGHRGDEHADEHVIGDDQRAGKLPAEIEQLIERHQLRRVELDAARLLSFPWQLIEFNADVIADDFARIQVRGQSDDALVYAGAHLVNPDHVVLGGKVSVRAGAVLDASDGPIVIGERATIMPNAVLIGPCYVGDGSVINPAARLLAGSSIGAVCKVGGEISDTIVAAYSNKQHDGFLGNSYVGEWVNIGAATNNSDLKNNYSPVRMWCAGAERDTGRQFLGLLMGDHSKTGINVVFNTGTVIGFNSNVFSSEMPAKFIPSFSWGHGEAMIRYELNRAIQTAAVVMERRAVRFTPSHRGLFESIFAIGERAGWNV